MTQLVRTTVNTNYKLAKPSGDRLGELVHIQNYNLMLSQETPFSGVFDRINLAGIPIPNAAVTLADGGAGAISGTPSYAVTLYDENTDSESNPAATLSIGPLTSKQVTVGFLNITNERENSTVTHYRLYRTLTVGSTGIYFRIATLPVTTLAYTDNATDAAIQANDTLETDNDAPEQWNIAKAIKGYMFNAGGDAEKGSRATHSKLGNPNAQPLLNQFDIEPGRYGNLVAIEQSGEDAIFYKQLAIFQLHFDEHPNGVTGDGIGKTMNTNRGALNGRCVVNMQGTHIVMDQFGIYVNAGGTAQREIGRCLKAIWEQVNWSAREWFAGCHDGESVYFTVALGTDTIPHHVLVMDMNAWHAGLPAFWTLYEYDFGIVDCVAHQFGPGGSALQWGMPHANVAALMTDTGHTAYFYAGYRDLVSPSLTARGTVTGSSGTTNFADSTATFEDSVLNCVGAYVAFKLVDHDQTSSRGWTRAYPITAHPTASSCTLGVAAPSAIPVGTEYVIGRIPNAKLYTPVVGGEEPWTVKRQARLALEFQPAGIEATGRISMALDRKAPAMTAMTRETGQVIQTKYEQGAVVKIGGSLQDGGRIGVHALPGAGDGFRLAQVILEADDVDCPWIVDGIHMVGVIREIEDLP